MKRSTEQSWYHTRVIQASIKEALYPGAELVNGIVVTLFANLSISLLLSLLTGWEQFVDFLLVSNCIGFSSLLTARFLTTWLSPYFNELLLALFSIPTIAMVGTWVGYSVFLFRYNSFWGIYLISLVVSSAVYTISFIKKRATRAQIEVNELENKNLATQQQAMQAELLALQNQIEPHFLFNTLANVQALIDSDRESAKQLLSHYTDFLRGTMCLSGKTEWPLSQELSLIQSYLQVQQLRFRNIAVEFQLALNPQDLQQTELPPLLLQPLIENAIRHGLGPNGNKGTIRVIVDVTGPGEARQLVLRVEDDGVGLSAQKRGNYQALNRGNGLALSNIRRRLQLHYGPGASLELSEQASPNRGCCAELLLPLGPEHSIQGECL